ncbi:MAG: XkdX family protein [Pseudoflavonifractor capillosus]|nr:XkdX family protein [Pseudoflavonifractor capillosus]MCI5927668.1 XkdX family protein [Pseudoflavonifractor capillosus]MDY4662416.1 XkdX family protein [Pseudoflavonifractor capillosus]
MDVFELAKQYYPRLWNRARLEALAAAGKLTEEQLQALTATAAN